MTDRRTAVTGLEHARRRVGPGRAWLWLPAVLVAVLLTACAEEATDVDDAAPAAVAEPADDGNGPAGAPDPSEVLDGLISEYADARQATSGPTRVREVSAQSFLDEIDSNRDLLARIRAVDPGSLELEERIDRLAMIGLLESDIHLAEKRRIWENDASLYVPARQIGRLLEPQAVEPAGERAVALKNLLDDLPARLETARENLATPPARFTENAIFKARGTRESLANDGASLAGESTVDEGAYTASLEAAIEALDQYAGWLESDLMARSTGSWAIGRESYDFLLRHRWLMDTDAEAILARGQQAFEETEALAQEVSERIQPGRHWAEVYETLKDEHPPADGIKAAYQRSIDRAQDFVIEHRIVTLPDGERVVTVDTPPAMRRSSPFGTFQSVDPFGDGLEGQLVLTPIEDWMTPEQQAARLRSHHDAWIPIIAVHEAYPGHHVDALKTRENPRLLRKIVREPIFSEGWGLFTEELMFERGFLTGDDVRLTQLRNRLWRAARVILDVSLHTDRMSFDDAVSFLAEKVRFEPYAAELEVGMYTERPTYVLGYLIGMQEIMKIREEWIATHGEPEPPSRFYDPLLTVGALPPVLVRASLFGELPDRSTGAENAPATQ